MLSDTINILNNKFNIDKKVINLINESENQVKSYFNGIEEIEEFNQYKVLKNFHNNNVEQRFFNPSTGYGYDDVGRDKLDKIFAGIFNAEDAIVRPQIASGTHALSICLFALLRPNDKMLSITGRPYDTLSEIIGIDKKNGSGSLADFGIKYSQIDLNNEGKIDLSKIKEQITPDLKVITMQRSRGYAWRSSLDINDIKHAVEFIKNINKNIIIMVDNCYGEFTESREPTDVGADIIVGSLIKNPGGGLAPTGGYIAGRHDLIDLVSYRITSPGIGREVGSYAAMYTPFYQGIFMAPHVVAQSLKGAVLISKAFENLGFNVMPESKEKRSDITQSIKFEDPDKLITFCQGIQMASPVDSMAVPTPWDMPGYDDQVIMAAGTFVQGASIELSADGPIRPPYTAYMQGGLTYDHCKIGALIAVNQLWKKNLIKL